MRFTRRRSLLPFDRGGEVRLYDESLHVHDVALALLGKEGTKDFHTRPRRLPRIPNSKFRIHAQRAFITASMSWTARAWKRRYKIRTRTGPLFCKLLIVKGGSPAWIRTTKECGLSGTPRCGRKSTP